MQGKDRLLQVAAEVVLRPADDVFDDAFFRQRRHGFTDRLAREHPISNESRRIGGQDEDSIEYPGVRAQICPRIGHFPPEARIGGSETFHESREGGVEIDDMNILYLIFQALFKYVRSGNPDDQDGRSVGGKWRRKTREESVDALFRRRPVGPSHREGVVQEERILASVA
ncbi:MAG: hypothetical protein BWY66_01730 [bacterium ADurb.Bin374]|nr:MAG: hypothetical protein BWY66_01730 [bacterium ADurb.Bin374]